jgi:hypothetical protein
MAMGLVGGIDGELFMPRFFFNVVYGEHTHRDWVGQEFPTEQAALDEARLVAGELVRDAAYASRPLDHILEVTDRNGTIIISFRCSDPEIAEHHRTAGAATDPR